MSETLLRDGSTLYTLHKRPMFIGGTTSQSYPDIETNKFWMNVQVDRGAGLTDQDAEKFAAKIAFMVSDYTATMEYNERLKETITKLHQALDKWQEAYGSYPATLEDFKERKMQELRERSAGFTHGNITTSY